MTVPPVSPINTPAITAAPPTIARTRPSRRPMALAAEALTAVAWSVASVIPKRTAFMVGANEVTGAAAGPLATTLCCAAAGQAKQRAKQRARNTAQVLRDPAVRTIVSSGRGLAEQRCAPPHAAYPSTICGHPNG